MNRSPKRRASSSRVGLSHKATEIAKNLLSALFMAVRAAHSRPWSPAAFESAVESTHQCARELFQATGGFDLRFASDGVRMNESLLRIDALMRPDLDVLREHMEGIELRQLSMRSPPSLQAIRRLLLLFTPDTRTLRTPTRAVTEARSTPTSETTLEPQELALRSYCELVSAVRARRTNMDQTREHRGDSGSAPREPGSDSALRGASSLARDRADLILRLSMNNRGAPPVDLHGANTCLIVLVLGQALGLDPDDLYEVASAALFHHLGAVVASDGTFTEHADSAHASLARSQQARAASSLLRAMVFGEQPCGSEPASSIEPHPYARIVAIAAAYGRLVTGFGTDSPALHPLSALARLFNESSTPTDRDLVDLLINVLRVFPVGCSVRLDDGRTAIVTSQLGGVRWDRPMVQLTGQPPRNLDLSVQDGERYVARIHATTRFLNADAALTDTLSEEAGAQPRAKTDLGDVLERVGAPAEPKSAPSSAPKTPRARHDTSAHRTRRVPLPVLPELPSGRTGPASRREDEDA